MQQHLNEYLEFKKISNEKIYNLQNKNDDKTEEIFKLSKELLLIKNQ